MTQNQLDHSVAAVTGDDVREIRRLGFNLVGMKEFDLDEEAVPQLVDWDEVDRLRYA